MRSSGWFRLWIVASVLIISGSIFFSLRNENEKFGTGSSWRCVPGTYTERVEKVESGYTQPKEAEIEAEFRRLRGDDDPVLRDLRSAAAELQKVQNEIDSSAEGQTNKPDVENAMRDLALRHLAEGNLQREIIKDQTYFSCTTYWGLIRSILMAVALSVAMVIVFGIIKWVLAGFQGKK